MLHLVHSRGEPLINACDHLRTAVAAATDQATRPMIAFFFLPYARHQPKGGNMSPERIFQVHLVLGYVAWLLCFGVYVWPKLKAMDPFDAQRVIATLHSFRFFGLAFIMPGVVSPQLPASFAVFAAYGDLATGVLAMLALLTARIRPLFWLFVVAFNVVGATDLIFDYYHAIQAGLPAMAGQLGATYAIPVIYVPLLTITHVTAFYLMLRPQARTAPSY
ncbi:hypothetical protein [Paraburkholderia sp.]|uniref:hypothetical protein n=1 Tax=Paraburkholderia sp. TaxID=1926495 RepID=UPI0025D33CF8|nr:hypothetical protein [Paraburkholderia sp.]